MDAAKDAREREKQGLLDRLAELLIEEQSAEGFYDETPHFSQVEDAAIDLGNELSRRAQERASREITACCEPTVLCPDCEEPCEVLAKSRKVTSKSGDVKMTEAIARCHRCRWIFFPAKDCGGFG